MAPEQRLLAAVAKAFGGLSQVADEDLGRALAGHVRNQGWDESAVEHHAEVLAALMSEEFPESPPASRERIAAAARRSLDESICTH